MKDINMENILANMIELKAILLKRMLVRRPFE